MRLHTLRRLSESVNLVELDVGYLQTRFYISDY